MRRILLPLLAAIYLLAFPLNGFSTDSLEPGDTIPIEIKGGGKGTGGGEDPNGVIKNLITCYFSEDLSSLVFTILSDLGNVTITVTNFSTGEIATNVVNSQLGIVNFPISSDPGFYYISIVTSSGSMYYGQLTL